MKQKQRACIIFLAFLASACTPTIAVKAPEKPLEINMNIKIDHNINVKVDKEIEDMIGNNEDIF